MSEIARQEVLKNGNVKRGRQEGGKECDPIWDAQCFCLEEKSTCEHVMAGAPSGLSLCLPPHKPVFSFHNPSFFNCSCHIWPFQTVHTTLVHML